MSKGVINLPEKDFFTVTEIAQRWSCNVNTVYHYINDKETLRLGLQTKNIPLSMLCPGNNDITLWSLTGLVKHVFSHFVGLDTNVVDIDYMDRHDDIDLFLDHLDFDELIKTAISKEDLPKFLYSKSTDLIWHKGEIPTWLGSLERDYFLILTDINGLSYLLFDPLNRLIAPCFQSSFTIIPKEERDRFEEKNSIFTTAVHSEDSQESTTVPPINSKQDSRELVLRGWLEGSGFKHGDKLPMKQTDLWAILANTAPEHFQPVSNETIKEFFKKQNYCKFKAGRPKEG